MTFRFASLGSGSKGNGTLVEAGGVRVLIDCGFGLKDAQAAALLGRLPLQRLQHLWLTHLSETNNTPALALMSIEAALGASHPLARCATQVAGFGCQPKLEMSPG